MFAEDGSFIADDMPTATGHEDIRRAFDGAFQARSFQRELHVDHVHEGSDMALALTHATGTMTILAANNAIPVVSRELFVLQRIGRVWRIAAYMFNRPASAS
jgi:ketosteroid isomerase-like protein